MVYQHVMNAHVDVTLYLPKEVVRKDGVEVEEEDGVDKDVRQMKEVVQEQEQEQGVGISSET